VISTETNRSRFSRPIVRTVSWVSVRKFYSRSCQICDLKAWYWNLIFRCIGLQYDRSVGRNCFFPAAAPRPPSIALLDVVEASAAAVIALRQRCWSWTRQTDSRSRLERCMFRPPAISPCRYAVSLGLQHSLIHTHTHTATRWRYVSAYVVVFLSHWLRYILLCSLKSDIIIFLGVIDFM